MQQFLLTTFAFVFCISPAVQAGDDPGLKGTIEYVQKRQTKDGAFMANLPGKKDQPAPTLKATAQALWSLHYLRAPLLNKEGCVKFVASCYDGSSGGFADVPGGKPDVFTTAVAMIVVHDLEMPIEKYAPGATKYLSANVQSFEEIRIAAAGLEKLKDKAPRHAAWIEELRKLQNGDGTFGSGLGQARLTGGSVVALLRMGANVENTATIVKTLQEAQRLNGGFGKEGSAAASDLESTYRIMRCFRMLKARPKDVEGLRSFIAKCRNQDGGYAVTPGEESSLSGTYFAAVVRYWLDEK